VTRYRWMWAILLVAAAAPSAAAADFEQSFALREPLGHTWIAELVHRDLDIREAGVAASTFALADADGRPMPLQVEVLRGSPDAVGRVRLWFKATLPASQTATFRLTYNNVARAALVSAAPVVRREGGRLILSPGTGFEVVLPAPPEPFAEPLPFDQVPPILAVQAAGASEAWGRWRIWCTSRVTADRAVVEAAGPGWARGRLLYTFEDPHDVYEVTLCAVAGDPWIDCREAYRLPPDGRMRFVLGAAFSPVRVRTMPWFLYEGDTPRPADDLQRFDLAALGGEPFATLRPKWTYARGAAQACLAVGRGDDPTAPVAGIVAVSPGSWRNPYAQSIAVRAAREGSEMAFEFPLGTGGRRWALVAGSSPDFDSKLALQGLIRRRADIPLDRVLSEWVFAWHRDPSRPAPHVLTTLPRLRDLRADWAADRDTPATALLRQVLTGDVPGDRDLAAFLAGRRDDTGADRLDLGRFLDRGYQADPLDPAVDPRRLRRAIEGADLSAAGTLVADPQAALVGYIFSDPDYWPGYENGWEPGDAALHADRYVLAIEAAALLPDHPHAPEWMAFGLRNLRDDLRRTVFVPGGAGRECPGRTALDLAAMLAVMRVAQNSGLADPFAWPETQAAVESLRLLHTPLDPRLGRRLLVPFGDTPTWQDSAGLVFGLASAGLRSVAPALAGPYAAMYRQYDLRDGSGDAVRDLLLADPSSLVGRLGELDWTSRRLPGFGAVLRSRFAAPDETFVAFKCGPARGHYHGDELAFHFYGAGMPLALDWSCGRAACPDQEHMHNRVNLGDDENMDAVGELIAFRTSDVADLAVGQLSSTRLRKMPHDPTEVAPASSYARRTLTTEARLRRYLLLVKHPVASPLSDYLVVRDEVLSTEPATFNLFVLARSITRDGRRFFFDGQLAADAVAYVAAPAPGRVRLERWGWPRADESAQIPADFQVGRARWYGGELQQCLRVTAAPGQPFLVVLYPYRKGAPVPAIESLAEGKGVRVSLNGVSEDVYLATDASAESGGQATVHRDGGRTVLLRTGEVPRL